MKKGTYTRGLRRYYQKCNICGYEWMAFTKNPIRCALCMKPMDNTKDANNMTEDTEDKNKDVK